MEGSNESRQWSSFFIVVSRLLAVCVCVCVCMFGGVYVCDWLYVLCYYYLYAAVWRIKIYIDARYIASITQDRICTV